MSNQFGSWDVSRRFEMFRVASRCRCQIGSGFYDPNVDSANGTTQENCATSHLGKRRNSQARHAILHVQVCFFQHFFVDWVQSWASASAIIAGKPRPVSSSISGGGGLVVFGGTCATIEIETRFASLDPCLHDDMIGFTIFGIAPPSQLCTRQQSSRSCDWIDKSCVKINLTKINKNPQGSTLNRTSHGAIPSTTHLGGRIGDSVLRRHPRG